MTADRRQVTSLIIGGGGFVGPYLAAELQASGNRDIHLTKLSSESVSSPGTKVHDLDVQDPIAVKRLFDELQPNEVFHLAAQSSVAVSWDQPELTIDINVKGSLHVLESARALPDMPQVLLVGSSEEYGTTARLRPILTEDDPARPMNVYALTKTFQNTLGHLYATAYRVPAIMVRAFNHIGPGQSPRFVASDFCRQVALIEANLQEPVIRVGNLSALRDFSDVRDIVRAYALLAINGVPGETYNVGTGHPLTIKALLDQILLLTTKSISIEVDDAKYRPVDIPSSQADISKIQKTCGWYPHIKLEQTLLDTLNWWRSQVV